MAAMHNIQSTPQARVRGEAGRSKAQHQIQCIAVLFQPLRRGFQPSPTTGVVIPSPRTTRVFESCEGPQGAGQSLRREPVHNRPAREGGQQKTYETFKTTKRKRRWPTGRLPSGRCSSHAASSEPKINVVYTIQLPSQKY